VTGPAASSRGRPHSVNGCTGLREPRADSEWGGARVVRNAALADAVEAAKFLRKGRNSIYILAREGKIPHYRVGNSIRFDLNELRAWLESNRRGPKVNGSGGGAG
jgi:excisionase family DNA binding protein